MTGSVSTIRCYIATRETVPGVAETMEHRLAEKVSDRRVEIVSSNPADAFQLQQFLFALHQASDTLPNLYESYGFDDFVEVSGDVIAESPEFIRFVHNDHLSYQVL
jgi:hypothetical protein